MKKNIFIHIGSPKTGSTSIQGFLSLNYKKLLAEGFYYPNLDEGRNVRDRDKKSLDIWINGGVLHNINSFKVLLKKFNRLKCRNLILSDEALFDDEGRWYNKEVKKLLNNYQVKLIVYLRPAPSFFASYWQELLKYNLAETLEDFITEDIRYPYYERLLALKNLILKIKKENVVLRVFSKKKLFQENLIYDFLNIIKLTNTNRYIIPLRINVGIDLISAQKILYFNKCLRAEINTSSLWYKYFIESSHQRVSIENSMSKNTHDLIRKKYAGIEGEIAGTLFRRKKLFDENDFNYTYISVNVEPDILFRLKVRLMVHLYWLIEEPMICLSWLIAQPMICLSWLMAQPMICLSWLMAQPRVLLRLVLPKTVKKRIKQYLDS
ncbi:hypothetical protein N8804_01065 [Methylophilaceae bacterium]|nr:hypothetical protein [Methylophilaceae bacterium]